MFLLLVLIFILIYFLLYELTAQYYSKYMKTAARKEIAYKNILFSLYFLIMQIFIFLYRDFFKYTYYTNYTFLYNQKSYSEEILNIIVLITLIEMNIKNIIHFLIKKFLYIVGIFQVHLD